MKFSLLSLASFAIFCTTSVLASPVAISPDNALIERDTSLVSRDTALNSLTTRDIDIDIIVNAFFTDVKNVNSKYNSTCSGGCSQDQTSWCSEISKLCYTAIDKCKQLPEGHKFLNLPLIAGLVYEVLLEINFTLQFLLGQCGILELLLVVIGLVFNLIAALNGICWLRWG
ncbi:hypothetical protein K440DRAFT_423479 [Wilcoxina mikolae CBS 423.85]|nr:hypothetical protein K440DRAFT_423479 [Wilcoxina mikolae CBS 423.85]